jgi:hypothetical protein
MMPAGVNVSLDAEALRPLIQEVVAEVLAQLREAEAKLPEKLCYSEQEAARLLSLNVWQLRDERLRGRISASAIVGKRIRYARQDLIAYLASRRGNGGAA